MVELLRDMYNMYSTQLAQLATVVYNHWTGTVETGMVDWNGGIAKFSKVEFHTLLK